MSAIYIEELQTFLKTNPESILGVLTAGLAKEGFDTNTLTTFSWQREIHELGEAFRELVALKPESKFWSLMLEYVFPVIGSRIDCVLIADDLIYVIEYKGGSSVTARAALQQAQEYAANLVDFHEASRGRIAIPIALGAFKSKLEVDLTPRCRGGALAPSELGQAITKLHQIWSGTDPAINVTDWNESRYFPIPTIIEAASAIYAAHDVKDLANSRAGNDNLELTQLAVRLAVKNAIQNGTKKLLVITGVPGAGKTLAGLNIVQHISAELNPDEQQASFVSGNGPLVAVIQEALKRSVGKGRRGVSRAISSRIREVHRFVRDTYANGRPPAVRLIVFDEAQRAWTAAKNNKKFEYDISEPEMLLEVMSRHDGWAVVIVLVGGGQEIHGGEAGLAAWGSAIKKNQDWQVVSSPEALFGGPSVAGSRLFRDTSEILSTVSIEPAFHLAVSKRSFESDVTAAWVNAVLDGETEQARSLAQRGLPIVMTRDLGAVREWLLTQARGRRRIGLVASSGAARLRADGVETPTFKFVGGIDYVKWFLEPLGDYRSSNQLEIALSEFEVQGLELDLTGLLWGGDLIFPNGKVLMRQLKGTKWTIVEGRGDTQLSADDPRTKIQNKYRVLLTRFRKGMVIFIPTGDKDDPTRLPEDFDSVYDYLSLCGISSIQ